MPTKSELEAAKQAAKHGVATPAQKEWVAKEATLPGRRGREARRALQGRR